MNQAANCTTSVIAAGGQPIAPRRPGPLFRYAANALWAAPGSFAIARLVGYKYWLRSIVFHNITATDSAFTRGMSVNITPAQLEAKLKFLKRHYTPVSLDDVVQRNGQRSQLRPVLVTFDDAYASVLEIAAPLCAQYGVPAIFFVNAAFIDNGRLAPDNLVCYVANEFGMDLIKAAVRKVLGGDFRPPENLASVFGEVFPHVSLPQRQALLQALAEIAGIDQSRLAAEARLYITAEQLRDVAHVGFEIGNHTRTHVHCRQMEAETMCEEIDRNRAELERFSGTRVRAFSVPYGSASDCTPALDTHLRRAGYDAVFLSESVANPIDSNPFRLDRVSTQTGDDATFFLELEVLPRLRGWRNRYFRRGRLTLDDRNQ